MQLSHGYGPEVQLPPDPDPWRTDLYGYVLPELQRLLSVETEQPKQRFWIRGDELIAKEFPGADWLIRGLISKDSLTIIGADPKASKTWALLEIALAISAGGKAMGEYPSMVEPSPVALFLNEDNERSVKNRLRALCSGHGYGPQRSNNIRVLARETLDLGDVSSVARFVADVRQIQPTPVLIGIDPLRNVHDAEESSSTEMRPILRALGAIRRLCGCALVVVHHAAKANKDDKRTGGSRLRGSSAIDGYRDGLISLEETEKDDGGQTISNRVVVDLKAYRGAGRFGLSLHIEDDDNGEAIRATWVRADDTVSQVKKEDEKAAKRERIADFIKARLMDEQERSAALGMAPTPVPMTPIYKAAAEANQTRPAIAMEVYRELVAAGRVVLKPISDGREGGVLGVQWK
jgi:hypothetical protein